jgi:minor extracellular serine protease Vpr
MDTDLVAALRSRGASKAPRWAAATGTGLGALTNQPPTGPPALGALARLAQTTTTPTVTIGGASANVQFSGLAPGYVGLYQANAQVPPGSATGPAVPLTISIGGGQSNTVTMAEQ